MTTFVALGDSITVGMGDQAPDGGWRGWTEAGFPIIKD